MEDILYLITDGKGSYIRYDIGSRKYVVIKNKFLADKWEDRGKAQNILNSSLPKNFKKKYRVRETKDDRTPTERQKASTGARESPPPAVLEKPSENVEKSEPATKKEPENIAASITVSVSYPDVAGGNIEKIKGNIKVMTELAHDNDQRISVLIEQLTQVDRELSDIAHYMEFKKLDGFRGYQAYKMFHDRRIRRRVIKDELSVLQGLSQCKIDSAMLAEVRVAAENLEERKYRPRALPELFDSDK